MPAAGYGQPILTLQRKSQWRIIKTHKRIQTPVFLIGNPHLYFLQHAIFFVYVTIKSFIPQIWPQKLTGKYFCEWLCTGTILMALICLFVFLHNKFILMDNRWQHTVRVWQMEIKPRKRSGISAPYERRIKDERYCTTGQGASGPEG